MVVKGGLKYCQFKKAKFKLTFKFFLTVPKNHRLTTLAATLGSIYFVPMQIKQNQMKRNLMISIFSDWIIDKINE